MNRLSAQSLAVLVIVALAAFAALRDGERANDSLLRGRTGELSSRDRIIDATVRQLDFEGFVDDDSVDFVYEEYYDEDGQDDDNDDISSDEDDDDNDDDDDDERKLEEDFGDDDGGDDSVDDDDYAIMDDDETY